MKFWEYFSLYICSVLFSAWTTYGIEVVPSCTQCIHVNFTLPSGIPPVVKMMIQHAMNAAKLTNLACEKETSDVTRVVCNEGSSSLCTTQNVRLSWSYKMFKDFTLQATVISRGCKTDPVAKPGTCSPITKKGDLDSPIQSYLEKAAQRITVDGVQGKMCFKNP